MEETGVAAVPSKDMPLNEVDVVVVMFMTPAPVSEV
jgi:hypothetical protein